MSRVILHVRRHEKNSIEYMDYSGNQKGAMNKLKKLFKEDQKNNTLPDTYSIERVNYKGEAYRTTFYSIEELSGDGWEEVRKAFRSLKTNRREPSIDAAVIDGVL